MRPTPPRPSLAWLMGFVGAIALGLGAVRDASELSGIVAFNLAVLVLLIALVGALLRRGDGAWVGFAVFGWSYGLVAFVPAIAEALGKDLATTRLCDEIVAIFHSVPIQEPSPPLLNEQVREVLGNFARLSRLEKSGELNSYLSMTEQDAVHAYLERMKVYRSALASSGLQQGRARQACQSFLAITFALFGALAGRALAPAPRNPGLGFS